MSIAPSQVKRAIKEVWESNVDCLVNMEGEELFQNYEIVKGMSFRAGIAAGASLSLNGLLEKRKP